MKLPKLSASPTDSNTINFNNDRGIGEQCYHKLRFGKISYTIIFCYRCYFQVASANVTLSFSLFKWYSASSLFFLIFTAITLPVLVFLLLCVEEELFGTFCLKPALFKFRILLGKHRFCCEPDCLFCFHIVSQNSCSISFPFALTSSVLQTLH